MQRFSIVILCSLFVVAAAPWLVSSCAPNPLLPPQLSAERADYETRVAVAQQATLAAQRLATSPPPRVVPIGTLDPVNVALPITPTLTAPAAPLTTTTELTTTTVVSKSPSTDAATAVMATVPAANSTVRILGRATVTQTGTPISTVVIVRATQQPPTTSVVTSTVDPSMTNTLTAVTAIASAPQVNMRGMSAVEDIITDEMLREQVQKSNSDGSFSDIGVSITPDGVRVTGKTSATLIEQPFTMTGTFFVENESLAIKVESILLNGVNVTARYRSQLEDEIRWQLYQLLPQRFVQSFTLNEGQIVVQSLKR